MASSTKTFLRGLGALLGALAILAPAQALAGGKQKGKTLVGQVNLNTATPEELSLLPGVGPARAEKIVEARTKRAFKKPWEVTRVKGIGPAFFKKHKDRLRVDGETTLALVDETVPSGETPAALSAGGEEP